MSHPQKYYFIRSVSGVITGPFTRQRLQEMLACGRIRRDDCYSEDQVAWRPVKNWIPENPVVPRASAPPPPQTVAQSLPRIPVPDAVAPSYGVPRPVVSPPFSPVAPAASVILEENTLACRLGMLFGAFWISPVYFPHLLPDCALLYWIGALYGILTGILTWFPSLPIRPFSAFPAVNACLFGLILSICSLGIGWFSLLPLRIHAACDRRTVFRNLAAGAVLLLIHSATFGGSCILFRRCFFASAGGIRLFCLFLAVLLLLVFFLQIFLLVYRISRSLGNLTRNWLVSSLLFAGFWLSLYALILIAAGKLF